MNKTDIVKEAFVMGGDGSHLADNFQGTDAVGGPPLDKAGWVGMGHMMKASFPDIEYVIEDMHMHGDDVHVQGYFKVTFSNDLDLSQMGMGVIPASGKMIQWPSGSQMVSFEGEKIVRAHDPDTGPNAGLAGFLKPITGGYERGPRKGP